MSLRIFILFAILGFLKLTSEVRCSKYVGEICGIDINDSPTSAEEVSEDSKAEEDNEDNPDQGEFFYQGDILLTKAEKEDLDINSKKPAKRDAKSLPHKKWQQPQNIKYEISENLSDKIKKAIKGAIADFHKYTCLRFVPKRGDRSKYYMKFVDHGGCFSYVGRLTEVDLQTAMENKQLISLTDGCSKKGNAIHEIMHALGFYHEHTRLDRDNHINVIEQNIRKGRRNNFNVATNQINLGTAYDFNSVMHYSLYAFSVDPRRKPTMQVIGDAQNAVIGQRDGMTDKDIQQINIFYNCRSTKRSSLSNNGSVLETEDEDIARSMGTKTRDKEGGTCELAAKEQLNF